MSKKRRGGKNFIFQRKQRVERVQILKRILEFRKTKYLIFSITYRANTNLILIWYFFVHGKYLYAHRRNVWCAQIKDHSEAGSSLPSSSCHAFSLFLPFSLSLFLRYCLLFHLLHGVGLLINPFVCPQVGIPESHDPTCTGSMPGHRCVSCVV